MGTILNHLFKNKLLFLIESPEFESSGGDEDLKNKLNNLSIAENKGEVAKKSLKRRNPYSKNTVIEIKKVNRKTERMLNQNIIEFALHYINTIVKTTNKDWQITRNFVTNMVEVNYNRLAQLESKISNKASDIKNEIKIRFIQPAQEFYNQLMEIWIIFKTNSCNKEVLRAILLKSLISIPRFFLLSIWIKSNTVLVTIGVIGISITTILLLIIQYFKIRDSNSEFLYDSLLRVEPS